MSFDLCVGLITARLARHTRATLRYGLAALLLSAAGCTITPPSDRIACGVNADCPEGYSCNQRADGQWRCSTQQLAADAGRDAGPDMDGGHDAGVDAMRDAGRDAGEPTSTPDTSTHDPERRDAGAHDPPTGMEELPPLLRRPLPECGKTPDPANAYFVSAGVGEDIANCGGPQGPCRTLRKALQRAADDGVALVYLDNTAVYVEPETLQLPAEVIVVGGFSNVNGRWTRLCDSAGAKTRLMSSGNPALVAERSGTARLVALNVEQRAANAGETMIGVLARGALTQLGLESVSIVAADGGDGEAGAAGSTLPGMSATCSQSDGAEGERAGAPGADAVSGSFGADGYTPADGSSGGEGAPGHAGVSVAPACVQCMQDCPCPSGVPVMSCGDPGAPGCGGAAGSGGLGGHGGGSSIALFAWDAQVFVAGGSLRSGAGGDGGVGGAAGGGGEGAAGAVGAAGAACSSCQETFFPDGSGGGDVICFPQQSATGPGSQGGTGGHGRDGGPGGSGAPGASYAAYGGGAARLEIAPDTTLAHGQPGSNVAGALGPVGLIAISNR